ncbi:uncharacterized protein LOC132979511 [Labrus mixtus]|uniref:uncharacterized protein LOC132979511 n=1 Tax=Labrus mixtus TaxID=508554 RepID=UPI0029C07528|nr:uncharacterized protein LOC132979511 [Labrus mixtus]
MFIFMILGLLAGIQAQGTPRFVQTGTDLLLDVKKPVDLKDIDLFAWSVGSVAVVRLNHGRKPTFSPNYASRAELSAQTHSLLLKNVQKRDSGVYRARVFANDAITVAEYNVTVLDPVSGVKLTVKPCSSDSTNVTMICSTEDSLISSTFTCNNQTCSHEGGERAEIITPGASLDVYLENSSVICNHSNQVSSTRDIQKIEDFCVKPEVTPRFVQTGTDLLLDVKKPVDLKDIDLFTWSVNGSVAVVRLNHGGKPVISPNFKSRAELSAQTHSLLLKNVQKRDSGVYRARVAAERNSDVAEYNVTVLDPVSGVKLTVKLCSSDSTNVTVICSTEDSLISSTFTGDTQTCSHEGGERAEIITPGGSLDVYLEHGSVICNHSNQVSYTRDIQKIEDLCRKPEEISGVGFSIYRLKIYVVSIGLVIMMCAVISVHVVEKLKKKK